MYLIPEDNSTDTQVHKCVTSTYKRNARLPRNMKPRCDAVTQTKFRFERDYALLRVSHTLQVNGVNALSYYVIKQFLFLIQPFHKKCLFRAKLYIYLLSLNGTVCTYHLKVTLRTSEVRYFFITLYLSLPIVVKQTYLCK